MGVYLPNMEMPEKCGKCRFFAWSRGVGQHCAVASDITFHATIDGMDVAYERNGNCPLVPVPPHYDLIDHNALKIAVMDCDAETRIDFLKHAMDCINEAPVVIPSDMPTYEADEGE